MSAPHFARLVSRLFREESSLADGPPASAEARHQAIEAIAKAIASRRRRLIAVRTAGGVAAAAAAALGILGGAHSGFLRRTVATPTPVVGDARVQIIARAVGGAASVVVSGANAPLSQGNAIARGSRLVTPPNGRSSLAFSTGTTVDVGEGTDLTLAGDDSTQVVRLAAGTIDLHVAKLAAGQRFLVDTADSEVEVHGTRFRVSIVESDPACGQGVRTRVSVTEGVVSVRSGQVESRLLAGGSWPEACVSAHASTPIVAPRQAVGSWRGGSLEGSTLADENDLFAEALAAKRQGDSHAALIGFDHLLARYPSSALAESAAVERMRLLAAASPLRAVPAARQYLGRYPKGFAHAEAEAIVAAGP